MIKNILKEVIIVLLLCVVITVILGVIFYDFNPIGKVVPSKIAYSTPENIAEDLKTTTQSTETDLTPKNKVYTIDGSDLNAYKKTKAYDASKDNPFANTAVDSAQATTTTSKVDTSGNSGSSSSSSSESNSNSGSSEENSGSSSSSEQSSTGSTSSGQNSQATGKKAKLK